MEGNLISDEDREIIETLLSEHEYEACWMDHFPWTVAYPDPKFPMPGTPRYVEFRKHLRGYPKEADRILETIRNARKTASLEEKNRNPDRIIEKPKETEEKNRNPDSFSEKAKGKANQYLVIIEQIKGIFEEKVFDIHHLRSKILGNEPNIQNFKYILSRKEIEATILYCVSSNVMSRAQRVRRYFYVLERELSKSSPNTDLVLSIISNWRTLTNELASSSFLNWELHPFREVDKNLQPAIKRLCTVLYFMGDLGHRAEAATFVAFDEFISSGSHQLISDSSFKRASQEISVRMRSWDLQPSSGGDHAKDVHNLISNGISSKNFWHRIRRETRLSCFQGFNISRWSCDYYELVRPKLHRDME